MSEFLERLRQEQVVVVIRGAQVETLQPQLQALYDGGLRIFEITVESAGAIDSLVSIQGVLPNDAIVGVGTVLDGKTATLAIAKGAKFVVSPILRDEVYQATRIHKIPCILGGTTPTEIYNAYQLGCEAVKVFPASGAAFIRELQNPLGQIPLLPTGGITLENAAAFLQAGAAAIGVGGALMQRQWLQQQNWLALKAEASRWAKFRQL